MKISSNLLTAVFLLENNLKTSCNMKYNFDEIIERRGTCSYKWDSAPESGILPMWVADMDFRTAQPIVDAVKRRASLGVYGYTRVPDSYYSAVVNWFASRHQWTMDKEWIIYTSGVVPALSAVIKALTAPGDKVLVQTPVYNCFFSSIRNNGCEVLSSPLKYENSTYHIDFEDFERKASDPSVKIFLLCNPHNPAGRVWTRAELTRMGEICLRHGVTVVSDEIHCELVMPGHSYTPFASLSDEFLKHSVTCTSPSKSFNMAGLQIANITVFDKDMRRRIDKAININEVCDVNPFGVDALIAAYNEGEEWLSQLISYLYDNYLYMAEYCAENLSDYPLTILEGTYLVWMDCHASGMTSVQVAGKLREETGLWLNAGTMYGPEGEGFIRWNIACPRSMLADGLSRFSRFADRMK